MNLINSLSTIKTTSSIKIKIVKNQLNPKYVIRISNKDSKYRLKFGGEFSELLDSRDKVLEHSFDFSFHIDPHELQELRTSFISSRLYSDILKQIKEFLVEAISNIVSIAFKFLNSQQLLSLQAMEYASKNILLNVTSIISATVKAIQRDQHLHNHISIQELKTNLSKDVDMIMNNILINLADSYPQAPISGGTLRMKQIINEINRINDEENDLIMTSDIKIADYLKFIKDLHGNQHISFTDQDNYVQFIMRVINAAISITHQNQEDSRERTMMEIFTEFNQKLFWVAEQKKFKTIAKYIHTATDDEEDIGWEEKNRIKEKISKYFDLTLEKNPQKLNDLYKSKRQDFSLYLGRKKSNAPLRSFLQVEGEEQSPLVDQLLDTMTELMKQTRQGIQNTKNDKLYLIGQKIPSYILPFRRFQITNKDFISEHSSVLRVLTKWAGYLEFYFKNPQQYLMSRRYPFKTVRNELVYLQNCPQSTQRLIEQLKEEYEILKSKFNGILRSSYGFIGQFLSIEKGSLSSNVHRYSQTRTISSKINSVLTSLMLKYTSSLIHHLLKAGRNIWTCKHTYQNINLLTFRVSDLMRAKYQCSQSGFITLLKTLYTLDHNQCMQGKFKLIRIKNKLDQPANNIIINYLFMGKIQCELQLSIQEPSGKTKNYYTISHFLYQLTRGKFGPIAETAIKLSQTDPMITACKSDHYTQKEAPKVIFQQNHSLLETGSYRLQSSNNSSFVGNVYEHRIKQNIFQCNLCQRLVVNDKKGAFPSMSSSKICNQCILKKYQPQKLLESSIKPIIQKGLNEGWFKKLNKFSSLKKKDSLAIIINQIGKLHLYLVVINALEFKTFGIRLDNSILQKVQSSNIDFSTLDYVDISSKRGIADEKIVHLVYRIQTIEKVSQQLLDLLKINRFLLENKLDTFINLFRQFRIEKNLIKALKFKAEFINSNQKHQKWQCFDKVIRKLVFGQKGPDLILRYKKYKHLTIQSVRGIHANNSGIKQIPHWLKEFWGLTSLLLNNNQITKVQISSIPPQIQRLGLQSNQLKQIDLFYFRNLNELFLNNNFISNIDLSRLSNLKIFYIHNNKIENIDYLPSSLLYLWTDRKAVINYDYQHMTLMKQLYIFNGDTTRQELLNLQLRVDFKNMIMPDQT